MEYINQLSLEYDGLFRVFGAFLGVVGFLFGAWRYFKERKIQKQLEDRQRELDNALSRLKHLDDYADGLKQYSTAV